MKRHHLQIEQVFHCPVEEVFAFFSEHTNLEQIWPGKFSRIAVGSHAEQPNGLGSVRQIDTGVICFEETIVGYDENKLIQYSITRNSPFNNYLGTMEFFTLNDQESFFRHTMEFTPKVPGTYWLEKAGVELVIRRGIKKAAKQLSR